MDIRNWPLDRIMQLPDCCFGRRFPVCLCAKSISGAVHWDISEVALPERCVIWSFNAWSGFAYYSIDFFRLALGDHLPTTTAEMDTLEPLFHGFGFQGAEPRNIPGGLYLRLAISDLRMPIFTSGLRPVLEVKSTTGANCLLQVVLIVSSLPTEVPDWLISGPGRSR